MALIGASDKPLRRQLFHLTQRCRNPVSFELGQCSSHRQTPTLETSSLRGSCPPLKDFVTNLSTVIYAADRRLTVRVETFDNLVTESFCYFDPCGRLVISANSAT